MHRGELGGAVAVGVVDEIEDGVAHGGGEFEVVGLGVVEGLLVEQGADVDGEQVGEAKGFERAHGDSFVT